jgi:hypothetical protein
MFFALHNLIIQLLHFGFSGKTNTKPPSFWAWLGENKNNNNNNNVLKLVILRDPTQTYTETM